MTLILINLFVHNNFNITEARATIGKIHKYIHASKHKYMHHQLRRLVIIINIEIIMSSRSNKQLD